MGLLLHLQDQLKTTCRPVALPVDMGPAEAHMNRLYTGAQRTKWSTSWLAVAHGLAFKCPAGLSARSQLTMYQIDSQCSPVAHSRFDASQ